MSFKLEFTLQYVSNAVADVSQKKIHKFNVKCSETYIHTYVRTHARAHTHTHTNTHRYRVEVSNRFAALEYLDVEVEINTIWETIRENIKISTKDSLGYYKLKKHKPWFHK
jgi:predicted transcriptional regulator